MPKASSYCRLVSLWLASLGLLSLGSPCQGQQLKHYQHIANATEIGQCTFKQLLYELNQVRRTGVIVSDTTLTPYGVLHECDSLGMIAFADTWVHRVEYLNGQTWIRVISVGSKEDLVSTYFGDLWGFFVQKVLIEYSTDKAISSAPFSRILVNDFLVCGDSISEYIAPDGLISRNSTNESGIDLMKKADALRRDFAAYSKF